MKKNNALIKLAAKSPLWLNYQVIATVLIIKILILFFGYQSYLLATGQSIQGLQGILRIWNHWDAIHYLNLAQDGYTAIGENRFLIVFFPLYPLLIYFTSTIIPSYLFSAFIVTGIASIALGLVFRELVKLDYHEGIAQRALLFLFIFPTSYFLHIPYTESLFLALTVGCFLMARKRFWLMAGLLGALACFTRINGLILIPAIAFEVWDEYSITKQLNKAWASLLLVPLGFSAYLGLNYLVTGNPTTFLIYQREHWYRYFRVPWEGILETYRRLDNPKIIDAQIYGIQELIFVGIGLFAIVFGWKYLRNSYRAWMVLNWLLFISTSFVLSVPRYMITLFPLFILMSLAADKRKWLNTLFIVWSLLYLSLFINLFVKGWWAF